jgi:hypothetical protein
VSTVLEIIDFLLFGFTLPTISGRCRDRGIAPAFGLTVLAADSMPPPPFFASGLVASATTDEPSACFLQFGGDPLKLNDNREKGHSLMN